MKRVEISREIGYINEISDEEIVLKAKGGNKLAQEKIINKYEQFVRNKAVEKLKEQFTKENIQKEKNINQ